MLRILFLVQAGQRAILDRLYDGICAHSHCELVWMDAEQQKHLKAYFKQVRPQDYDFVMVMLRNKKVMKQVRVLKKIPNLVFLEHDAWQNYSDYKYQGKFSWLYRKLPQAAIISSGYEVTQKLRSEGFNVHFVPKGYDQQALKNLRQTRDIEVAFVGSINRHLYKERAIFLDALAKKMDIQLLRTKSGDDYLSTLNRIRYFISADVKFGEYMLKNFEAMACGCLVFAYDQGEKENQILGLEDMTNIVLYRDVEELLQKIAHIKANPALDNQIREAGQALVASHFTFDELGRQVVEKLELVANGT